MKILTAIIIIFISVTSYSLADTETRSDKSDNYLTLKEKYMAANAQINASLRGAQANITRINEYHNKIYETISDNSNKSGSLRPARRRGVTRIKEAFDKDSNDSDSIPMEGVVKG